MKRSLLCALCLVISLSLLLSGCYFLANEPVVVNDSTEASSNSSSASDAEPAETAAPETEAPVVNKTDAYAAYAAILSEKGDGRFMLIYVDDDDIAELAYFIGAAHLHSVALYTFYNGEAVYLDNYGIYGTIAYSERNNRIFGYTGMDANPELEAQYTYKIENGTMVNGYDGEEYESTTAFYGDAYENNESNRALLAADNLE